MLHTNCSNQPVYNLLINTVSLLELEVHNVLDDHTHLWGPLLADSIFLSHFSQSGESPPDSRLDPSPWIRSSRTEEDPITDLINWIASEWDLLSSDTPLTHRRRSPFCGGQRSGDNSLFTQQDNYRLLGM